MTMRETMMAVRDWAALAGAFAMVGFLTFAPQHAPVAKGGDVAPIGPPGLPGLRAPLNSRLRPPPCADHVRLRQARRWDVLIVPSLGREESSFKSGPILDRQREAPPSVLPDISPSGGEISSFTGGDKPDLPT